jgi:hypothetical protein
MSRARPFLLAAVAAACHGDPVTLPNLPDGPAPAGALRMAARIDGRTYIATDPEGFPVQQIEVNKGGIRLAATFQGSSASGLPVNQTDHQLTVAGSPEGGPLPERVVFSRTDAFSGTLYWIAPGQAVELWVGLYHVPTARHVMGPFPVTVERRSHGEGGDAPAGGA